MKRFVSLFFIVLFYFCSLPLNAQEMSFMGIPMVGADTINAHLSELGFSPIKKSKTNTLRGVLLGKEVVTNTTEQSIKFINGERKTLSCYLQFFNLSKSETIELFNSFVNVLSDENNVEPLAMQASNMLFLNIKNADLSNVEKCESIFTWQLSRHKNFTMYHSKDKLCIFFFNEDL